MRCGDKVPPYPLFVSVGALERIHVRYGGTPAVNLQLDSITWLKAIGSYEGWGFA